MPISIETKSEHFGISLLGSPVFESNAVGSDKNTCAVVTEGAVDEDFLRGRPAKKAEEFGELRRRRIGKAANRNGNKLNAERFGPGAFLLARVCEFAPQIHNDGDAELFQFRKICKMRLSAAKKMIGNFSDVGNTRKRDLFRKRRSCRRRENGRLGKRSCGRGEKKRERDGEREKSHRELARKSLGGSEWKKKRKREGNVNETAPQDIDT